MFCALIVNGQSLIEQGDICFKKGDYDCAQSMYKKALDNLVGDSPEIKRSVDLKLQRANFCLEYTVKANDAFKNKNFQVAKENYELVLKENSDDTYAKSQLEKSIEALTLGTTLVVSKSYINFGPSENSTIIDVKTNASKFEITRLPIWCTTRNRQSDWFSLVCKENYSTQSRSDYLIITAGDKQVRIDITQSGKTEQKRERVVENTPIPEAQKEKEKVKIQKTKIKKSPNSFFAVGLEAGEIANYGVRMEFGGKRFVGMFFNARSTFKNDSDILRSAGFLENKNEAVLGLNFKISRSIFLNLGGGYGFYKQKLSSDIVENIDYYPAYGGLTFRLGNRFNLSGGASFMNIEESINSNRYRPEYTVALTINLKK